MRKRDDHEIMQEFRVRQTRQVIALAVSLFLVLLVAVIYKRPDMFGEFSPRNLFAVQAVLIAAFIGFTAANWRCPLCKKYLGGDVNRRICKKCGTRLQ